MYILLVDAIVCTDTKHYSYTHTVYELRASLLARLLRSRLIALPRYR